MKRNQIGKIQNSRSHLIDLLRFIAAAWVALFHFNEPVPYIHNFYREICKLGFLGVPIFFVISGYCIGIAEYHAKTSKTFIVRRLFRIVPPYWANVLLIIFLALGEKLITGTNSIFIPKELNGMLATIFLYTYPVSHFNAINWVYWTLSFEIVFYFLISFFMFFSERIKMVLLIALILVAIIIPLQEENILFFFNELPIFMIGYALYSILNKSTDIYLGIILITITLVGIFIKHPGIEYMSMALGVCGLIFIDRFKPLKANFFSRLGDYSYSLYLIHVPIGIYLLGFIKNIKIVQINIYLNLIEDLCILALLVFISKFTFKWVELKSIELGKRYSKPNSIRLK